MPNLSSAVGTLQLFAEPTRLRLLALLAAHELTVAELVGITEVGQSSVSTHLGKLRDAGVLRDRRMGASTLYALNEGSMPAGARQLWSLVRGEVGDAVLDADRARCEGVLKARQLARPWPEAAAGQMERHYSPGRTWEAAARGLVGLMTLGDVLDVGAGDGTMAHLVAPRARSVTCVDVNARMVAAARARLGKLRSATVLQADAHDLPLEGASFDHVMLFNVLTQVGSPERVLKEVARVLRPGGNLAVVALAPHDHADVSASYNDVHPGFAPARLKRMLAKAGLTVDACAVTSRERRPPHFEVVTASARK